MFESLKKLFSKDNFDQEVMLDVEIDTPQEEKKEDSSISLPIDLVPEDREEQIIKELDPLTKVDSTIYDVREIELPPTPEPTHIFRNVFFVLAGIAFLGLSFFVVKYGDELIYRENLVTQTEKKVLPENDFLNADYKLDKNLDVQLKKDEILEMIQENLSSVIQAPNQITVLNPYNSKVIYNDKQEPQTITEKMRGDDMFFIILPSAPLALRSLLSNDYAIGTTNVAGINEKFIAFKVSNPPVGYREMISYETRLYSDMKFFLSLRDVKGVASYKDVMINNHALRVYTDEEGIVFMYGFLNLDKLVIARNIDTLEKVFERLR